MKLCIDGWAGRREYPVEIVRETAKRYLVKLLSDALLPGGRRMQSGDTVYVPKYAISKQ